MSFSLAGGVYAQGLVKFEKERNIFASSIQGLTMTLFLFWTIIYLLFHDFWNYLFNLTTVQMIAMLIMIWTTSVFNLWSNDQRVDYKYKALVIITLIVSIAKPVIGIILVINANDKVIARILGLVLVEMIGYSWLSFVQIKKGKIFYYKKNILELLSDFRKKKTYPWIEALSFFYHSNHLSSNQRRSIGSALYER